MAKPWLQHYPQGVPHEIDPSRYQSIIDLFDDSVHKYRDRVAFMNMGSEITYEDLNYLSADFASFLQNVAGLRKGDRIAIQMPNLLQYPIVMYAALRLGLVVVNVNPLYTARELKHILRDSGAKAIVIFANSAHLLEQVIADTPIQTTVVTEVGDVLGFPKSLVVNLVVRYIKKMIPAYRPKSYTFYEALDLGTEHSFRAEFCHSNDLAFLQYTGGTTGLTKGAMLTHRNIIANMLQMGEWMRMSLLEGEEVAILALPLYHVFCLTLNGLGMLYYGATNIMITNPRDMDSFVRTLRHNRFTVFPGINTLFNGLMNHKDFDRIDFSALKVSVAGACLARKRCQALARAHTLVDCGRLWAYRNITRGFLQSH